MQASANSTAPRRKVVPGRTCRYHPAGMDSARTDLQPGEIARVVNLPGCPRANAMGHCHVKRLDGTFAGPVLWNSLEPEGGAQ